MEIREREETRREGVFARGSWDPFGLQAQLGKTLQGQTPMGGQGRGDDLPVAMVEDLGPTALPQHVGTIRIGSRGLGPEGPGQEQGEAGVNDRA